MNNFTLSFYAQSLDDRSPDHVGVNNRLLTEDAECQDLAQKISEVSLNGDEVFSRHWHSAFLLDNKFLLETPSDQLDDAGRIAPILCHGHVPDKPPVSWASDVVSAMVRFAERIERTVSDESQEMARRGVEAILEAQKKNQPRMRRKMLGVVALLIVLGVVSILWTIFFKK